MPPENVKDVKIEPKDKVEIKGSRVTMQGQPVLIAAEVKKGDETLKLRDDAGIPLWAGWDPVGESRPVGYRRLQ